MNDKERREHLMTLFKSNDWARRKMDKELGTILGVSRRTAARDISILKTEGRIIAKFHRYKTNHGWCNIRTIVVKES